VDKDKEASKRVKDRESGVARGIDFQFVANVINFDFPKVSPPFYLFIIYFADTEQKQCFGSGSGFNQVSGSVSGFGSSARIYSPSFRENKLKTIVFSH
jgi:hypothetical protein